MTTLRETLAEAGLRERDAAHLEAVVLAWVGARLAGAREVVSERISDAWLDDGHGLACEYRDAPHDVTSDKSADAALTALRDALGVPVAPAGGEVGLGSTGSEIGPQNGAEGCAACPFLGCDNCEAEVARRANGEAT